MGRLRFCAVSVCVTLVLFCSSAAEYDIDTTAVREPVTPEKSFGQTILNLPTLAVKIPLKVLKGMARVGLKIGLETTGPRVFIQKIFGTDRPLHPLISYGSKSSFDGGLGLRLRDLFSINDQIRAKSWYSINKYQRYQIRYEAPQLLSERVGFTIRAAYHKLPRESFYGLGNDTRDDNEASITHETGAVNGEILWHLSEKAVLLLTGGYSSYNLYDGEETELIYDLDMVLDSLELSDNELRQARLINAEARLWFDWRNHKGQPSSGGTEDVSVSLSRGTGISRGLSFWSVRADLWQYLHLFRKRILAARILVHSIDIISDEHDIGLPYYLLPALGGEEDLRGYRRNRFFDGALALATLEYRYPLWSGGDAFLFVDEGRVFDSFGEHFTLKDWRYSFGIGIRVWSSAGETLRFTVAQSKEEIRFYFNFGQGL